MHPVTSLRGLTLNKIAQDKTLSETITAIAPHIPHGQLGYVTVNNVLDVQRGFLALPIQLQKTYLETRSLLKDPEPWVAEIDQKNIAQNQQRTANAIAYDIFAYGPRPNQLDRRSAEAFIELNFREINVALLCKAYLEHGKNEAQKQGVIALQAEVLVDITQSISVLREINGPLSHLYPTSTDGKNLRDFALRLGRILLAQHAGVDREMTDIPDAILEKLPVS